MSKLSRLRGNERYAACDDEDTAAELGCSISRVCPVIPPVGIWVCTALTLPNRHYAGVCERRDRCRRPPRLSTLHPHKPRSGGARLIDFFVTSSIQPPDKVERVIMSNKVFIVHGYDDAAKLDMARTLEKAGFKAIIPHERPDTGRTIIEKFEDYADVSFAVVLYTECDVGHAKDALESSKRYRARQNVVFEHGFFIERLGRDHVCAFVKGDVETPGDLSGVIYVPMDKAGAWKMSLAKNMNAVGFSIDMNKFI